MKNTDQFRRAMRYFGLAWMCIGGGFVIGSSPLWVVALAGLGLMAFVCWKLAERP